MFIASVVSGGLTFLSGKWYGFGLAGPSHGRPPIFCCGPAGVIVLLVFMSGGARALSRLPRHALQHAPRVLELRRAAGTPRLLTAEIFEPADAFGRLRMGSSARAARSNEGRKHQ